MSTLVVIVIAIVSVIALGLSIAAIVVATTATASSNSHGVSGMTFYLYIADFAKSFIQIPTSNVAGDSSTIASSYLAGRAPIYNASNDLKVGTCSASFLSEQTNDGIFTDISNYLATDSGLIVTWFTPTTLLNLELDSLIHSMVTECTVTVTTKVGVSPFYGQTFQLIVSSSGDPETGTITFQFTPV